MQPQPSDDGRSVRDGLPAADACGHFGLRIARDGTWYYHGSPIGRKAITKLFATVLRREDDGSYWLVTPAERGRIDVDDVPFVAVDLEVDTSTGRQRLILTTNLDETTVAGPDHPIWLAGCDDRAGGDGLVPYVHVRDGLDARLSRPVYYRMAELAVEAETSGGRTFGVWSDGAFFPLDAPDRAPDRGGLPAG